MAEERILIVDDSPDIRSFVVDYVLGPAGYDCLQARDGLEGFEIITSSSPDLVITDLQMPRLDGLGLLYKMRENKIQLPVVLMTFHGSEELAIEVFRLGVRDYLIKPFEEEELLGVVERALVEIRLRKERDKLVDDILLANRKLERQVAELEALFDVGKLLTGVPDSDTLLSFIVETAVLLTGAYRVEILLTNAQKTALIERVVMLKGGKALFGGNAVVNAFSWKIIRSGKTEASSPFRDQETQKMAIQVCTPLMINDESMGVLNVYVSPAKDQAALIRLVDNLADYTAVGLELFRLYGEIMV